MKSADRALRVLQTLARHARPMPTMAIARECQVPKSSAHNLLKTMRAHGFVTYYPTDHSWALGPSAFEVGAAYLRTGALGRLAQPLMAATAEDVLETVTLWVPAGADVVCVASARPVTPVASLAVEPGARLSAHTCAAGLAVLAALPMGQVRMLFGADDRFEPSATVMADLAGRLDEVRLRGHAIEEGALGEAVASVAGPVIARDGLPVGAVKVTYPVARSNDDGRIARLSQAVRDLAGRLSQGIVSGVAVVPQPAGAGGED